jgi:hypothetical protein
LFFNTGFFTAGDFWLARHRRFIPLPEDLALLSSGFGNGLVGLDVDCVGVKGFIHVKDPANGEEGAKEQIIKLASRHTHNGERDSLFVPGGEKRVFKTKGVSWILRDLVDRVPGFYKN